MLDYGRAAPGGGYGNDFAAMPKVVQGKGKYKDPYGTTQKIVDEYYPQNIMHDRRVARGSTYAAMVIPAGTNPEAMMSKSSGTQGDFKKKTTSFKKNGTMGHTPDRPRNIYPNRDIPTPEPVPGRLHMDIQTEKYIEILTDKPPSKEEGVATEFYLDRPPVPLFQPKMPSKENCKATQIFDQDPDLFDFDNEIEPMLNVLVRKTLEQARMMVLEEEELRVMKDQKKEYEEVRNAELIEAQKLEAAEIRRRQELDRRKIQQKARKEERKAAHKKYVSRVLAKQALVGLKENTLRTLVDQGVLIRPITKSLHESVMPWLIERMQGFLKDDNHIDTNVEHIVADAWLQGLKLHAASIAGHKKLKEDMIQAEEQRIVLKELERQNRRELREKRRKQQELEKLKAEIKKSFIDKGDIKDGITSQDLFDVNGNFEKGKSFAGAIGGQLLQFCIILQALEKMSHLPQAEQPEGEEAPHKKHPGEIIDSPQFVTMLLALMKDMKNESGILIQLNQTTMQLVETFKYGIDQLPKLNDDQLKQLKESISVNPGHFIFHRLRDPAFNTRKFDYSRACLAVVSSMLDIASKKIQVDHPYSNKQLEQIIQKAKFVPLPKGMVPINIYKEEMIQDTPEGEPYLSKHIVQEKNTKERAIVRMRIPRKLVKEEVTEIDEETGQEVKKTVERHQEIEIDDKVYLIPAMVGPRDYTIYSLNQSAPRAFRRDVFNLIRRQFADYFEGRDANEDFDEFAKISEEIYDEIENKFLAENVDEEKMPLFDFEYDLE